ncbi:MAG: VCBS repeat-containing protein, partial [Limnochordia bacterium]
MSAKWSLMFLLSLLIIAGCSLTAQADYLLEELPYLHNSVVAVASVLNNGRDQIISGLGNELRIYDQGVLIGTITGFAGNVTAVAAGDLTGDFRPEIIIGTDNFNFYVYQHVQGTWRQVVERRYLWSPVVRLLVADITGNGWGDVVVLTERGEAFVYLGWDGELDLFWRSQPNANVKYV